MKLRHCIVAALAAASPMTAGAVQISEVLYDAVGSDGGKVFVEIYGSPGQSLAGWVVEGINGAGGAIGPTLQLDGLIPADGFFVVADVDSGLTQVAEADLLLDFDFQNGPDSIALRNAQGGLVDALGYGDFGPSDVFAGEGTPAADPPAGHSLARRFADLDTNDNAADFVALLAPTPGAGPLVVAEPGALLLLACGVSGSALLRRRRR